MADNKTVLASNNAGKLREMRQILAPLALNVVPQSEYQVDEVEETGLTFIENALLKARHCCECTGLPAIADDSGLAVDALNGAPGIYSARYSGANANDADNLHKLLDDMASIPDDQRQAQFHCALVYLRHREDPTPIIAHGIWRGSLLRAPVGDNGFGYDPIFWVPTHHCSSAQLDPTVKNQLSHRGQALRQLVKLIQETQAT